jgi:uncharacterized protein
MADDGSEGALNFSVVDDITALSATEWDALANPAGQPVDPFLRHHFLSALEASGCASSATGWTPRHLIARDDSGALIGALPLYAKSHSRGEYIFDHSWAEALHRAGGNYYPKLLSAVPFTPVTGRRLLTADDGRGPHLRLALARAAVELSRRLGCSSVHFNFLDEPVWDELGAAGFLLRTDQQFQWRNRGYASFDDFLAALSSRKRKMIRKERELAQAGLRIEKVSGAALTEQHWNDFFRFYMDTGGRKWGSPYLNRRFFALLHERMADQVLLVMAYRGRKAIAGALNLVGSDAIYGRYWGRVEDVPFLHFEVCYYQAIDFAIQRGLSRVEAGAQGEHKLARGYEPTITRSAHWIAHPGLSDAVADYLRRERMAVADGVEEMAAYTPFRRDLEAAHDAAPVDDEESY